MFLFTDAIAPNTEVLPKWLCTGCFVASCGLTLLCSRNMKALPCCTDRSPTGSVMRCISAIDNCFHTCFQTFRQNEVFYVLPSTADSTSRRPILTFLALWAILSVITNNKLYFSQSSPVPKWRFFKVWKVINHFFVRLISPCSLGTVYPPKKRLRPLFNY